MKSKKVKRRFRYGKTIAIYDEFDEVEKKQWYNKAQVLLGFVDYFRTEEMFKTLDIDSSVRKRELAVYTEGYKEHMKHYPSTEYTGVMFKVEKFYRYEDLMEVIDDKYDKFYSDKLSYKEPISDDDIRNTLSEKSFLEGAKDGLVKFYGENVVAIKSTSSTDTFRLYYALFMYSDYISKMFRLNYGYSRRYVNLLLFVYMYKFISKIEMYSFHSATISKKNTSGAWNTLVEDGMIEMVEYEKTSPHYIRQRKVNSQRKIYKITPKAMAICELYMDYSMFRKKIPYTGITDCDVGITGRSLSLSENQKVSINGRNYMIKHMMYEYMYDWVNHKVDIELADSDKFEELKKMNASDIVYNPFIYKITEQEYLHNNGEFKNNAYIKKFLNNYKFGYKPVI